MTGKGLNAVKLEEIVERVRESERVRNLENPGVTRRSRVRELPDDTATSMMIFSECVSVPLQRE